MKNLKQFLFKKTTLLIFFQVVALNAHAEIHLDLRDNGKYLCNFRCNKGSIQNYKVTEGEFPEWSSKCNQIKFLGTMNSCSKIAECQCGADGFKPVSVTKESKGVAASTKIPVLKSGAILAPKPGSSNMIGTPKAQSPR